MIAKPYLGTIEFSSSKNLIVLLCPMTKWDIRQGGGACLKAIVEKTMIQVGNSYGGNFVKLGLNFISLIHICTNVILTL